MLTDTQVRRATASAVRAPSLHNTQPWLFAQVGSSVHVRADRARWLEHEDPLGRELLISCGGALRHLVLGLREQGLDVRTELLPDPADPDLVAVVNVVGERPATLVEAQLCEATELRHTDRSAFSPEPVAQEVLDRLCGIAAAEGAVLDVLDDDEVLALSVLTSHADRVLAADVAISTEKQSWTSDLPTPTEGVPSAALPDHGARRGSPVPLRDFESGAQPPAAVDLTAGGSSEPPQAERPVVVVLGSTADDPRSWVSAGWVLSDLLLTLTSLGLVASPFTQPLEVPGLRTRLRSALGMRAHPQMVLRLGHPAGSGSPVTGRRPVSDVLR
ncbi:MAG: Acg family FMN-binding oxidoreductase [Mycobacteriales bacterium]